jgi:uncharacterized membrane protein
VEALCDGVFAIIITLLVLEIQRPNAAPGKLAEELVKEWPSYLAYAGAFLYVGVIWLNITRARAIPTAVWHRRLAGHVK